MADSELPGVASSTAAPGTARGRRIALAVLLLLSFLTVARIAAPLWVGLAFGTMVAFAVQPTYRQLVLRFRRRRALAAAVTTLGTGIVTMFAGGITIYVLTRELFALVARLQGKIVGTTLNDLVGERGVRLMGRLGLDRDEIVRRLSAELSRITSYATEAAGVLVSTTTSAMLGLIIGLMTMYYVLLEWPRIPVRLERVLPLDPRHTRALILEFRDVGRSALIGTLATALIQGVLSGIGYAVAGVPQPVTWGLLTALASFLPLVGTLLVWGPVGAYVILTGRAFAGFGLWIWGLVAVVGIVDYVVRPRIVHGSGSTNPLLMLIALLGGIEVFGLAGVLVGPVLMSLFVAILRIYEREMRGIEPSATVEPSARIPTGPVAPLRTPPPIDAREK